MMDNRNSLPIIQSLWIGGALSVMEQLCISSFLRNGHEFHLYTYGDVTNIPDGTTVRDGREILGEDRIFTYKDNGSYSGFSNVFRYKLLLEKGHYWVDMDVICLRPFDLEQEYVFSGAKKWKLSNPFHPRLLIQSCVIKTPPGTGIMKYCYEASSSKNPSDLVWGEIGPRLLDSAVRKFGLLDYVSPHGAFTTIDWPFTERYVDGSFHISWLERIKINLFNSYSLHLYHEMWRQKGLDKNGSFHRNSLYERLKKRYLSTAALLTTVLFNNIQGF
jgi:hypothetical protein